MHTRKNDFKNERSQFKTTVLNTLRKRYIARSMYPAELNAGQPQKPQRTV